MKKQNIEDLFSSMEDFSSIPPPELWAKIEEGLDKPKKKKRAILWWSAAACLLVGLLLPSVLYFTTDSTISPLNNGATQGETVVQGPNNKQTNDSKSSTAKQNDSILPTTDPNTTQKQTVAIDAIPTTKKQNQETVVAHVDSKSNLEKRRSQLTNQKTVASSPTNGFYSPSKNGSSNTYFEDKLNPNKSTTHNGSNTNLNPNAIGKNKETQESTLAQNNTVGTPKTNPKFSTVLSKQDSLQLTELQNLEKGILAPENNPAKETKSTSSAEKWALEVFAGLSGSENYKNDKTLGNLNDSKQSNSYGLKTKYKLNKKWAVSSGLKINQLGQSVANVTYINTKNNNGLLSSTAYFNQNETTTAPQIATNSSYVFVSQNASQAFKVNNIQTSSLENGNLDQSLRYIEMPLEVSYAIFSKNKASISLNTGGFVGKLISNNVSLNGSSIGENLNANEYVYGSVLSSTLQYRVYKKTNVFVEPAMNYYINPLNNQSFNQFQWGLNLGMNVSF
jgi:hypothetical protein